MRKHEKPDFIEVGQGRRIILIHSSVAGAKQWRSLMNILSDRFHLIAINMFGYGKTTAWSDDEVQTLADQAELVSPFLPKNGEAIFIVGHSFGGSVAMKTATLFREQVNRLVLIEPNPFYLLAQHERSEAYEEVANMRDVIKSCGQTKSWDLAAEVFANYWTGEGSWDAMPEDRRSKFAAALKPNFHEWDAVMNETTSIAEWKVSLPEDTTVISAADTVRSIREICQIFEDNIPKWKHVQIKRGGHMAALTNPNMINPIVENALS